MMYLQKYSKIEKRLLAAALLVLSAYATAVAQGSVSNSAERAALRALNNATTVTSTGKHLWAPSRIDAYPNPDSVLTGVTVSNGDIVSIDLFTGILLQGTLPQELNHLHALGTLRAQGPLTGTIPVLDSLVQLQTLFFNGHTFSGTFPAWIGNLTSLRTIFLVGQFNGPMITGPIPASFAQLPFLREVSFSRMDLSQTGAVPDLGGLDQVLSLSMAQCNLSPASFQNGIKGMDNLQGLVLDNNGALWTSIGADKVFPEILQNLNQLITLSIQGCPFDKFPGSITLLHNLQTVDLSASDWHDENRLSKVIDTLKICPALTGLALNSSSIQGLPDDFDELQVKYLSMSFNNLDYTRCDEWGTMPKLEQLVVQASGLTGLPSSLSSSTTLRILTASQNTGFNNLAQAQVIKDIPNLDVLQLDQCNISTLPAWFGTASMDTLRQLNLNFNSLVNLPADFGKMKNLQRLEINHNQLNGAWPASFVNMKKITYLDLSNNKITGLPDLSTWTVLQQVYLYVNQLTGTVPAFLSQATSPKIVVDLHSNTYDAIDPASLFNTFVSSVNIGDNNFTFTDVVAFHPNGGYLYSPQPDVDVEKQIFAYGGGFLTLHTTIDTQVPAPYACSYQWFMYVDGVHDVALNSPSTTAEDFTWGAVMNLSYDGKKFYYRITNNVFGGLSLKSKLQTLTVTCKNMVKNASFTAERYLCAMAFMPTVQYLGNCQSSSFTWTFGDNTAASSERTAWHAYANDGTYTVSMKLHYACGRGVCQSDTIITQQVTYNQAKANEVWQTQNVNVPTHEQSEVINVSATTFSNTWPMHDTGHLLDGDSYSTGQAGVWRNEGTHVYDVPRSTSPEVNLAKDGTFTLEQFNWQYGDADAIPNWIKANQVTQYSPFSYELENRDVLGIYSAALYDYGGHLPSANGVNMRNNEMAFSGFEFIEGNVTGNLVLGNTPLNGYSLYNVRDSHDHIAVVEAPAAKLENVVVADVSAHQQFFGIAFNDRYIQNDPVVCIQPHDGNPDLSVVVLKRAPFDGLWRGQIKVADAILPNFVPVKDTIAHTGKYGLKITSTTPIEQPLLHLDSGKAYVINVWVSINNPQTSTPVPVSNLGVDIAFRDIHHNNLSSVYFQPAGPVVEGWQQVRGRFVCPDDALTLTLTLRNGPGTAWYDDLRIHPEKANMKSYVYNLTDYRVSAILDEENFSSQYFYDREGNLFLVKKETERGIKTISENVSYQTEYKPAND